MSLRFTCHTPRTLHTEPQTQRKLQSTCAERWRHQSRMEPPRAGDRPPSGGRGSTAHWTARGTRLLFLEKVDWTADCFPLISGTEVHSSLTLPVLFLHRLILTASHRVPSVIAGDSPRCQAPARASASPLRIRLNLQDGGPSSRGLWNKKTYTTVRANSPIKNPSALSIDLNLDGHFLESRDLISCMAVPGAPRETHAQLELSESLQKVTECEVQSPGNIQGGRTSAQ